ncbi:MAG: hypothetical protein L6V88_06770 [Anaerotruncus sp.]|nr:MAG: hypothetical protein L6V88_06770 [Anaerotruncus sp.]
MISPKNGVNFTWREKGRNKHDFFAGMNGEYGVSDMHLCDLHYHAYSKAAWQSDGTLKLWIRPVETAHVRQFTFKFDGNNVQIKNDMQPRFEELAIYNMTFFWGMPVPHDFEGTVEKACA